MQEVWRDDIQPDDVVILQSGKYKLTPTEERTVTAGSIFSFTLIAQFSASLTNFSE